MDESFIGVRSSLQAYIRAGLPDSRAVHSLHDRASTHEAAGPFNRASHDPA